jgi:hypothetical protein
VPACIIRPKELTDALKGIPKRSSLPVLQRLAVGRNGNPAAPLWPGLPRPTRSRSNPTTPRDCRRPGTAGGSAP